MTMITKKEPRAGRVAISRGVKREALANSYHNKPVVKAEPCSSAVYNKHSK